MLRSLTVAGAAPDWLHKQRTGFPFNPLRSDKGHLKQARI